MQEYTIEDFKTFERDEFDRIICPSGDYTTIKEFPARSSFGERCSFGEWCKAISPFWGFIYPPPFETEGRIYPPESCRGHWQERLKPFGVKFGAKDCYETIFERSLPHFSEILASSQWLPVERQIIESWVKGENQNVTKNTCIRRRI